MIADHESRYLLLPCAAELRTRDGNHVGGLESPFAEALRQRVKYAWETGGTMSTRIDHLVRRSLGAFLTHVCDTRWLGRENEAVSLYALGFLLESSDSTSDTLTPTQIGIEVAAADAPSKGPRSQVRKDLVIWPEPRMNRWHPGRSARNRPLAILEWKVRRPGVGKPQGASHDLEWLRRYSSSRARPGFVGYSVFLDLAVTPATISVIRVAHGKIKRFMIPS